jgi:hypothetical protein
MEQTQVGKPRAKSKGLKILLFSIGPVAVFVSMGICIFFLVSERWKMFAILLIPPTLLYCWVALTYWIGYRQVNKADKLATMAATTGLYLFLFPYYGFLELSSVDCTLGLLVLMAIIAGAYEIRRWRRRITYLPLGVFLFALSITWLLRRLWGPPVLYFGPALLLQQSLALLALSVPAELYEGGAGDPPEVFRSGL